LVRHQVIAERPDEGLSDLNIMLWKQNNGSPVLNQNITVNASSVFSTKLAIRENDVFLINMNKL